MSTTTYRLIPRALRQGRLGRTLAVALLPALLGLGGCSDNIAPDGLEPLEGVSVEITPSTASEGFDASTHILTVGSAASTTTMTVHSNTRWSAEVTDCEGSWCSLTFPDGTPVVEDGDFIIQTSSNPKGSEGQTQGRECNVTIFAVDRNGQRVPDTGYTINVKQDRQTIGVTPSAFTSNFPAAGEVQNFTITANLPWRATVSEPDFLALSLPDNAPSSLTLTEGGVVFTPADQTEVASHIIVTVRRNMTMATRRGVLTISSIGDEFTPIRVEMTQSGTTESFSVSPTATQTVEAGGGEVDLTILSPNAPWSIAVMEADASWLTLSARSGEASDSPRTVGVAVAPNRSVSAREATLLVQADGKPDTLHELHIVQMGADDQLGVTPLGVESLNALYAGASTINFRVISLAEACRIESDCDWIVPGVRETGVGTTEVTVSVLQNDTWEMRSGLLTFKAGSVTRSFVLTQVGLPTMQPENNPTFSYPWLGGEWTQSSVDFNTVLNFPYGSMPEGTVGGAILWKGTGDEKDTMEYVGTLTPNASAPGLYELQVDLTDLQGDTYYSAYAFLRTPDRMYYARQKLVFKTPGRYPSEGDNNPPVIVDR